MQANEHVILLHGLCGSRLDMLPLAVHLKRRGFTINNWGYRSLGLCIERLAERIATRLEAFQSQSDRPHIHVVTHSMGGVILRAVLKHREIPRLRRVVMLAPPHQGSHTARKLTPFLRWLAPSLPQLSDAPDSYVNHLGNPFVMRDVEFGIIEAERDRVIARGAVRIEGYQDFATVDGHHGILTWYPQTWILVQQFLRTGSFLGYEQVAESRSASAATRLDAQAIAEN